MAAAKLALGARASSSAAASGPRTERGEARARAHGVERARGASERCVRIRRV